MEKVRVRLRGAPSGIGLLAPNVSTQLLTLEKPRPFHQDVMLLLIPWLCQLLRGAMRDRVRPHELTRVTKQARILRVVPIRPLHLVRHREPETREVRSSPASPCPNVVSAPLRLPARAQVLHDKAVHRLLHHREIRYEATTPAYRAHTIVDVPHRLGVGLVQHRLAGTVADLAAGRRLYRACAMSASLLKRVNALFWRQTQPVFIRSTS